MWFSSQLRNWRRLALGFRRHSPRRRRPDYGPPIEALECRTLLTAYAAATAAQLVADINAANKSGGTNTITLTAPTTSPYILANSADGANGLPVISKKDNLTIVGNGDTIERSAAAGTPAFRLFDVAKGASLTLEHLTVQNGVASTYGGAIYNQGTLVLSQVTVQGNTAEGVLAAGGGIWSNASLIVENSTIRGNVANFGNWSEPAFGGGIYIAGGTANITGSTFAGNLAQGLAAYGGAVYVAAGTVSLDRDALGMFSATNYVPGNVAEGYGVSPGDNGYGGAIYVAGGSVTLTNDYVQGNTAFDYQGTPYLGPEGGGIFIASGATVYLDSFTYGAMTGNSPDNVWGAYNLL
jgi:hypothetical protein